jgi:hypothetical protein
MVTVLHTEHAQAEIAYRQGRFLAEADRHRARRTSAHDQGNHGNHGQDRHHGNQGQDRHHGGCGDQVGARRSRRATPAIRRAA